MKGSRQHHDGRTALGGKTHPRSGGRLLPPTDEKGLLERAGATVVGPFGSAFKERDILDAGAPDGAVVDINLGKGPSFDFARVLTDKGIPFVFVTGYDKASIPDDLSHVPRVEKPIREHELISALITVAAGLTR